MQTPYVILQEIWPHSQKIQRNQGTTARTKIYDGNIADGCYYNGPTLTGVNVKYATDKKWANGVYYWMKYLYNNL